MRPRPSGRTTCSAALPDAPTIMLPQIEPWLPAERLRREYDAIGFFLSGHPLDDYATVLKRLRVQSWAEFSPRGEDRRDRRQGRRHRGVAHGAAHQDRQQDGHHGPVRSDRPFRGGAVLRRAGAISRRAGAGRCGAAAARRRAAGRGRPRPRAARRAAGCRRGQDPEGPADLPARHQAAGVDRQAAADAGGRRRAAGPRPADRLSARGRATATSRW